MLVEEQVTMAVGSLMSVAERRDEKGKMTARPRSPKQKTRREVGKIPR